MTKLFLALVIHHTTHLESPGREPLQRKRAILGRSVVASRPRAPVAETHAGPEASAPAPRRTLSQHVRSTSGALSITALDAKVPALDSAPAASARVVCTPCRCLCFGVFEHTTNNRPRRRTTRHASHSFFIAVRTCDASSPRARAVSAVFPVGSRPRRISRAFLARARRAFSLAPARRFVRNSTRRVHAPASRVTRRVAR